MFLWEIVVELEWRYSQEGLDWNELSDLYKVVPMANMTELYFLSV
jgi:hypothetical protein